MFHVACPTCGHVSRAKDERAGQLLRCPSCSEVFTCPSLTIPPPVNDVVLDAIVEDDPDFVPIGRPRIPDFRDEREPATDGCFKWSVVILLAIIAIPFLFASCVIFEWQLKATQREVQEQRQRLTNPQD